MTYYIFIEDGKINGAGQARILGDTVTNFEVTEQAYNDFIAEPTKYMWDGSAVVLNPNYDDEQLAIAKLQAKQTSYQALKDIEQFTFYIKGQTKGILLKNTPTMTIDRAIGELDKVAQQIRGLQAGAFRYYDIQRGQQLPSPELKPYDVNLLYFQMFLAYREADAYYTALEKQYNAATTIAEVNQIVASIDYKKTLADKVDTIYAQAKAMLKLGTQYKYMEIGSQADNTLPEGFKTVMVRCQEGADNVALQLPELVRGGRVYIENLRTTEVTLKPFQGEKISGSSGDLAVDAQTFITLEADAETGTWDVIFQIDLAPQQDTSLSAEFEVNPSGNRQDISNIKFGRGLTGYVDPDKNGVVVEVDEGAIAPPCYYATLAYPLEVTNRESDAVHRGLIWCDDIVTSVNSNYLEVDRNSKAIGIQEWDGKDPNVTDGNEFLVVFRASLKGVAPSNGFVELSIIDKATQDIIKDMNGKPLGVYKSYNAKEKLKVIRVAGIVKAKSVEALQTYMTNNFPKNENIVLNDHVSGNTCILIQGLAPNNRAGKALIKYELDNNERILINQRYVGDIYDSTFLQSYDMPETSGQAGDGETDADGSHLYNATTLNIKVENKVISFYSKDNDLCFFNWGKIFDTELSTLIQGEQLLVDFATRNPECAVNLQLMKWTGDPEKYTDKIITDTVNGSYVYEPNWEVVDTKFIAESQDVVATTATFTVPSDVDIKNLAIIVVPETKQNPMLIEIHKLSVSVANPRYKYDFVGFERLDEQQMQWRDDVMVTSNPLPDGLASYRFSGSNAMKKLPFGTLRKGNIPADLKSWDVKEGYDYGNQNDLAFYDDVSMEVDLVVNLRTDKLEPVYFYLTDEGKEIPDTRVEFTPKVAHEQEAVIPTMKTKARNGETIGLAWETTSENGAYLETDDKRYPMLLAKITTQGAV